MNRWERKLWFQKNKGKLIKRGTIALSVLLLVVGVIYITYSKFESTQEFTIINGKIVDNGDVKISYEYDGTKQSTPPQKSDGYILTEANCENGDGLWDDLNWKLTVSNITGKTKCNLVFSKTSNYKIVTYNVNGGDALTPTYKKVVSGDQIGTLPRPKRLKMVFTGWYTQASGGTKIESTTPIANDITIYAQWKTETETVIFNANNGGMMTGSIAGGWVTSDSWCSSGETVDNTKIFSSNTQNNGCHVIVMTKNKINFEDYSAIRVNLTTNMTHYLYITSSKNYSQSEPDINDNNGVLYFQKSIGWYDLDISSWTNTDYLGLGATNSNNAILTYVSLIS